MIVDTTDTLASSRCPNAWLAFRIVDPDII